MSKKIFVEGSIVINTPYFKYSEAGASFNTPPVGAEIIKTNKIDADGNRFLEISDENPQSIFDEYYAKEEFASYYSGAEFLFKNFDEVYSEFLQTISEVIEMHQIGHLDQKQQQALNKLFFISTITSLDTFICDLILSKITSNEVDFKKYYDSILYGAEKNSLNQLLENNKIGHWEQKIIDYVLRKSFIDIKSIKDIFKDVFNVQIIDSEGKMRKHFLNRHILVHRNGRTKNGEHLKITNKILEELIDDTIAFSKQIMDKITS